MNPLSSAPIKQRRKFCEMLLADEIEDFIFFGERLVIVHCDRPLRTIEPDGTVTRPHFVPLANDWSAAVLSQDKPQ